MGGDCQSESTLVLLQSIGPYSDEAGLLYDDIKLDRFQERDFCSLKDGAECQSSDIINKFIQMSISRRIK